MILDQEHWHKASHGPFLDICLEYRAKRPQMVRSSDISNVLSIDPEKSFDAQL